MVFPVSHVRMWELDHKEGWTPKNWYFWLWCWRRFLRVPWAAMISNKFILKEINTKYSLEELMLKLKFQCFGYLMWRADSLEKTLMLGKKAKGEEDGRGWDGWRAPWTQRTWTWANSLQGTGRMHLLQSRSCKEQTLLSDWTATTHFPRI